MEYRNSGNATHLSNGGAWGVGSSAGVEIAGGSTQGTVRAIGDATNENLGVYAKGAGNLALGDSSNVVYINGSTTPFKLVCGVSSYRLPDLSSFAQGVCTLAASGISTGDLITTFDFRFSSGAGSTSYIMSNVSPTSAGEITVCVGNLHNSSVSGSSGRVRWAYIDRT